MNARSTASQSASRRNSSGDQNKREKAVTRFTTFLMTEALLAFLNLAEQAANIFLKERDLISLEETPHVIFLLKVLQVSVSIQTYARYWHISLINIPNIEVN